jgi:SAM-dependent methyltransferase
MSDEVYLARQPDWYEPYLSCFERLDPPLLELGAGHGLLLTLAAERGIDAVGVEILEERVEICREKGLDVFQHDLGEPLPFSDASFGMIYCGQVIEHMVPDAQRVMLREAFRVLRPGGQFQVRSPCRHHEPSRLQPGHDHLLTPSELEEMLRETGFSDITDLNYPQEVPEIPKKVLAEIWRRYQPDLLSESASALCTKQG